MDDQATQTAEVGQPICPECGKAEPMRIAYGYPSPEMFQASKRGELALGGCEVEPDSPTWHCRECRHEWGGPPTRIDGLAATFRGGSGWMTGR